MLEKMDDFFKNRVTGYDEHMMANIESASEFYKFTAEMLPAEEKSKVLDLGCGTGLELEEYFSVNPTAYVTGIDLSSDMLKALSEKFDNKALHLINGSYFDVPFEEGAYDAAVSVESLHHFTSEQKLFLYRKLYRALKPGGYFILTDYFAESDEAEKEGFESFKKLKKKQGIDDSTFYHYDTPLTAMHETEVLKDAGFTEVYTLKSWGATSTLMAVR